MSEQVIWKYELPVPNANGVSTLTLPERAKVLSVGVKGDALVLWALVRPDDDRAPRRFRVIGTGWSIPDDRDVWHFRGTVQMGALVWHVWEQER